MLVGESSTSVEQKCLLYLEEREKTMKRVNPPIDESAENIQEWMGIWYRF